MGTNYFNKNNGFSKEFDIRINKKDEGREFLKLIKPNIKRKRLQ